MLDWKKLRTQLMNRLGLLGKLQPNTMQAYQLLSKAGDDVLDLKTKELISLACAVTTRCDGCIDVHAEAAIKAGCTQEEIAAALSVAIAMNTGAAMVYSARVLDAHEAWKNNN